MQPDIQARQRSWPGSSRKETDRVLAAHRAAGRPLTAGGVRSFVREAGAGPAVVFIHGMWGASFAYRKLLVDVADRGMRGIAWDLPGFGFADRPRRRDYSWAALGRFSADAVDALQFDRFHLVVHDVSGPVGFELAAARPDQVLSLTILNTMVDVAEFRPPWSMRLFRTPVLGELWKAGLNRTLFRGLMRLQGIGDTTQISNADRSRPVQVVWAADDPALALATYGEQARQAADLDVLARIPGKHFPQEDQPATIARHLADIVATVSRARPGRNGSGATS